MTDYNGAERGSVANVPEDQARRSVLKKLAAGTVVLAGVSALPDKWTMPLVEFGALPAHAVTSGETEGMYGFVTKMTIQNTGDKMSCDSIWQDRFVFPGYGPDYGPRMLIVWSDGNTLDVPDTSRMVMDVNENDFRKFQPGGPYSGNNPDIPTMEVYAARGTHPESVTIYYG
jgi:hypothetical protein